MSRLFSFGVMLTFSALLLGVWWAVAHGFWKINKLPKGEPWSICRCQLQNRDSQYHNNERLLEDLDERLDYLEKVQSYPSSFLYYSSASGLMSEVKKSISDLETKQRALRGDSIRHSLPSLIILLLLTTVFSFLTGRLMIRHGSHAKLLNPTCQDLPNWKKSYWILVLAGFILQESREIITSVLAVNKTWFGWNSFCLSTPAWSTGQIMAFGAYMTIGYPACIIWCLSRSHCRPKKLEIEASDGAWGVGDYVLFAQTWSLLIFALLLVPTLLWIKLTIQYLSVIYLLPTFGLFVGAGIVAARLVWQSIQLRLMYLREMQSLGSWSKIRAVDPPPDPTSGFLGDRWWSLPATILATITAFSVVIEWSGVGKLLEKVLMGGGGQ